jgi:NMD protein affecting ribosome stability and mRNA decay
MRFLFRVIFDTEAGNRTSSDPNFIKNIQGFMDKTRAEAAYFTVVNGDRNAIFIIDMQSVDMMPVVATPFFQMGAKVEFFPVMNLEDLNKGLSAAIK